MGYEALIAKVDEEQGGCRSYTYYFTFILSSL